MRLTFEHPKANPAEGCACLTFLFPPTRAQLFPHAYYYACHRSQRASFQVVAAPQKLLLSFL